MSNIAAGIPLGLAIGMGSGIAIGIASGKKAASDEIAGNIREFAATHRINVEGPEGHLALDQFIEKVCPTEGGNSVAQRKKLVIVTILGMVVVLAGLALLLFRMLG